MARSFKHIGVRWVIGMERNFIAHRKREIHERTAHGNRSGHLLSARNRTSFPGWTYPVRAHYLKIDSSSLWHAASSTTESAEWSEWSAISLRIAKREIYERIAHGNRPGHLLSARNRTSFPGWTYPVRAYYLKIDSSSLWHAASSTMYAGRADVTSIAIPLLNLLIFIFLRIQFDCAHKYLPNLWARALRYIFLQWLNSLNIWAWKPWVKWTNNCWTHV